MNHMTIRGRRRAGLLLEVHGLVEARLAVIKLFLRSASMTSREQRHSL
jgi:hypothetical protein